MALITCPDCGRQVSSLAPACPQCGAPIATATDIQATGRPLTTVQATAKRLKLHLALSVVCLVVGIAWLAVATKADPSRSADNAWPILLTMLSLAWLITTKIRIWWHHR